MGKSLKGKELGRGLTQRKDGRYQAKYYIPGSPKALYLYDTNLARLKKRRDQEKAKYIMGYSDKAKKYKVSEWFDEWMKLYKIGRIKTNTVRGYVDGFERATDFIGSVRLDCLTPAHIHNMVERLQEDGYAPSSVTHTLSIVKQLLQSAVDNRLIPMNPGIGISISQHEAITFDPITEDESKVLSKEEVDAFLNGAKNTRYYELFYILLNTGLRIGEISALLWSDIDFEKHRIRVCKTLNETTVFYDDSKNRLEETYSKKQIATPNREPHLFSVHPHKFRHTFVTRMNQSGMSPFTVRKIVGHAHVNMTEYYTHLEQEYISDEFNKFSEKYEEEKVPAIPEKNNKGKLWKITLIIKKY